MKIEMILHSIQKMVFRLLVNIPSLKVQGDILNYYFYFVLHKNYKLSYIILRQILIVNEIFHLITEERDEDNGTIA